MSFPPYWIRITDAGEQRVKVREVAYRDGRLFRSRFVVLDCNARGRCIGRHASASDARQALTSAGFKPEAAP